MKYLLALMALCVAFAAGAQFDCNLPGDLTGDSLVTVSDLTALLAYYGNDYTQTDQNSECAPVTYHGYTYDVVQIGEQCWFAENLRSYQYRNGDSLGVATVVNQQQLSGWSSANSHGMCIVPDMSYNTYYPQDSDWYWQEFGLLYSRLVVLDERHICPPGWSIPTTFDFDYINEFYPPQHYIEVGTHQDGTGTWGGDNSECASNLYGLTVRASGEISSGTIYSVTSRASFWSFENTATTHRTYTGCGGIGDIWGANLYNQNGGAIRCIQD